MPVFENEPKAHPDEDCGGICCRDWVSQFIETDPVQDQPIVVR